MHVYDEDPIDQPGEETDAPESPDVSGEVSGEAPVEAVADEGVKADPFNRLAERIGAAYSDKGELDDEGAERVLAALTEETLRKLPPEAQVALRAVPAIATRQTQAARQEIATEQAKLAADRAAIAAERKALIREQNELAELVGSDAMRALMAKAKLPVDGDGAPDLLTQEGQAEHMSRLAAREVAKVLAPSALAAEQARKRAIWSEFVEANPVLHEQVGRDRFAAIVGEMAAERAVKDANGQVVQKGSVSPSEWPRVVLMVQAESAIALDKSRRNAELQARAAAAAKVSKPSSVDATGPALPANFAQMTAAERAAFYAANPEVYAHERRRQGRH